MMTIPILGLLGAALLAPGQDKVNEATLALGKAEALSVELRVVQVGGSTTQLKLAVHKPNQARLETPQRIVVADGATLVEFDKAAGTYMKTPQTDANLREALGGDEIRPWASVLFPDLMTKATRLSSRGGASVLALDPAGKSTLSVFVEPADGLIRKATLEKGGKIWVVQATSLNLSAPKSLFAFQPPAGSREVSAEEQNADKWLTNLADAKALAAKTGKLIFVDFMAEWCGPCKQLEAEVFATDRFKKLSSKYVFVKIDVDKQQDVAAAYKIEAMPTQMILDAKGSVLKKTVGYGGPEAFYRFIGG
jgi:thiol-disulfide isomerase/thioredoxin